MISINWRYIADQATKGFLWGATALGGLLLFGATVGVACALLVKGFELGRGLV